MQLIYAFDQVRDITANVFTDDKDVIKAAIDDNNVDGDLWSKKDFVTMENELVDDDGRRVLNTHTTTVTVKNPLVKSPFFDPDTRRLKKAMVVQGNVPVSVWMRTFRRLLPNN